MFIKEHIINDTIELIIQDTNCLFSLLEHNGHKYGILSIYRSPNGNINNFLIEFNNVITNLLNTHKNTKIIIIGDLNINILDTLHTTENYLDILNTLNFTSHVNIATRPESNTCLDHVFTNINTYTNSQISVQVSLIDSLITDHYPVITQIIDNNSNIKNNINAERIIYSSINYNKLNDLIKFTKWVDVITDSNNANTNINIFTTTLQNLLKQSTTDNQRKPKKINNPWILPGILNSIKKRDKLHKLSRKEPFNILLKSKYKKYRNKLSEIIAKSKINYFSEKIKTNINNPKKIWSTIKQATTQNTSNPSNIRLNINNSTYDSNTDPLILANEFNNYFLKMGNHKESNTINQNSNISNNQSHSLYLRKITKTEISNIISNMKNDSAPGIDGISINVIKKFNKFMSNILEIIFNQILKEGLIPDSFKTAVVVPLYKGSGLKTSLTNYRPISLLNVFSKIFKKAVKTRLLNYLEENNLLPNSQYGFRNGLGTEDALAHLTNEIYNNIDKRNKTIGIFLDLSKAFDRISHSILLNRLHSLGITGTAFKIFESYLNHRTQQTRIGNTISEIGQIHNGVPQGTVLSPILYIIYVAELSNLYINGKIYSYADDTAIIVSDSNWDTVWRKCEADMLIIDEWFSNNRLEINYDKSKFIAFTNDIKTTPLKNEIIIHKKFNCNTITCTCPKLIKHPFIKYLGITIDQHLKWNNHIEYIIVKLRQLTYFFIIAKKILNKQLIRITYFAMAQSLIQYGIIAWGGCNTTLKCNLSIRQPN